MPKITKIARNCKMDTYSKPMTTPWNAYAVGNETMISAMPHAAKNTDPSRCAHMYTDTMLNPMPARDTSRHSASTISNSVITSPPKVTPSRSGPLPGFSPYVLAALSFGYSCVLTKSTNCAR